MSALSRREGQEVRMRKYGKLYEYSPAVDLALETFLLIGAVALFLIAAFVAFGMPFEPVAAIVTKAI
jgi:hypothetical protein